MDFTVASHKPPKCGDLVVYNENVYPSNWKRKIQLYMSLLVVCYKIVELFLSTSLPSRSCFISGERSENCIVFIIKNKASPNSAGINALYDGRSSLFSSEFRTKSSEGIFVRNFINNINWLRQIL